MKKHLFTWMLLFVVATNSYAQFYKALLPSPQFTKALESIVLDFRFDFRTIQAELVDSLGQVHTYRSAVTIPGTEDCKILRFSSTIDTTSCWQAIVYSGENYKEAVKAYENTVRLVKKSQMHWIDRSPMKFTGELIKAREDIRFTTSILALVMDDPRYRDFRAEVELINIQIDQWQVQLNLSKKTEVVPNLN